MRRAIFLIPASLIASAAAAVPPPPPVAPSQLALKADNCPVMLNGSVRPYSPATFNFDSAPGNLLVLVLAKANPNLLFGITVGDGGRFIEGAGFGSGAVWIKLPVAGGYRLQISAYDPIARVGTGADFEVKAYLRDEQKPGECPR